MDTQAYAQQRRERVELLKEKLFGCLVKPDGGLYLAKTGSLIKGSSLRGKQLRRKFAEIILTFSVGDEKARFWTKRLFKDALAALVVEKIWSCHAFRASPWTDGSKTKQNCFKVWRRKPGATLGIGHPAVAVLAAWAAVMTTFKLFHMSWRTGSASSRVVF